jgi:hypothetical protein
MIRILGLSGPFYRDSTTQELLKSASNSLTVEYIRLLSLVVKLSTLSISTNFLSFLTLKLSDSTKMLKSQQIKMPLESF